MAEPQAPHRWRDILILAILYFATAKFGQAFAVNRGTSRRCGTGLSATGFVPWSQSARPSPPGGREMPLGLVIAPLLLSLGKHSFHCKTPQERSERYGHHRIGDRDAEHALGKTIIAEGIETVMVSLPSGEIPVILLAEAPTTAASGKDTRHRSTRANARNGKMGALAPGYAGFNRPLGRATSVARVALPRRTEVRRPRGRLKSADPGALLASACWPSRSTPTATASRADRPNPPTPCGYRLPLQPRPSIRVQDNRRRSRRLQMEPPGR